MSEEFIPDPLVLVNRDHPLFRPVSLSCLVPVSDKYPDILMEQTAAAALQKLLEDIGASDQIVPVSGWRSHEEQQKIWSDTIADKGIEFARKYVAVPGCSEHESGLAIDLAAAAPDIDFICPDFPRTGICQRFREKAPFYGFIQRYSKEKEEITGISEEPWHFRYVGMPHSRIITKRGLALEEYIGLLNQSYTPDSYHISRYRARSGKKNRAWIELNRNHLLHNIKELQHLAGENCALMPALKADAYGHGDVLTARILQDTGISDYCTATVDEAVRLRRAGIRGQILILGYTHPDAFPELEQYSLTQTVIDADYAEELSGHMQKVSASSRDLSVHVAINTGMHRLGIPYEDMDSILRVCSLPGLQITGIFSHLCVSDGQSRSEKRFTEQQICRFRRTTDALHARGISGFQTHIQGSYGLLNYSRYHFDLARPGIALYGVLSSRKDRTAFPAAADLLKPVLSLKARIGCIRELPVGESAGYGLTYTARSTRKIAIVAAGYADGIPRSLSNRGHALVRGKRVPIIGRICMDQLTLDVTDVPNVQRGDEAVFIGRSGEHEILAEEMAEDAETITNEILSRIGERVRRTVV